MEGIGTVFYMSEWAKTLPDYSSIVTFLGTPTENVRVETADEFMHNLRLQS